MAGIGGQGFDVTFHGVRGSTPCQADSVARYGGNTACVSVDVPGAPPILIDLGTGSRAFGLSVPSDRPFHGVCLLSHMHWDHLQGLPFFPPLLRAGSVIDLYAPLDDDGRSVGEVIGDALRPPLFPVGLDAFPGEVRFHDIGDDEFSIGEVRVSSRLIPHVGNTCGFRIEWGGGSVAYIGDHQQPGVDDFTVAAGVRELCDGVDLLIHDAQYTPEEFAAKPDWGHCTIDYAIAVAVACGASTVALFHHDPLHDDDRLDQLVAAARAGAAGTGVEVIAAREHLTVHVG